MKRMHDEDKEVEDLAGGEGQREIKETKDDLVRSEGEGFGTIGRGYSGSNESISEEVEEDHRRREKEQRSK